MFGCRQSAEARFLLAEPNFDISRHEQFVQPFGRPLAVVPRMTGRRHEDLVRAVRVSTVSRIGVGDSSWLGVHKADDFPREQRGLAVAGAASDAARRGIG